MRIGIIGSGNVGSSLANGLIRHGHDVMLGTRDIAKPSVLEFVEASDGRGRAGRLLTGTQLWRPRHHRVPRRVGGGDRRDDRSGEPGRQAHRRCSQPDPARRRRDPCCVRRERLGGRSAPACGSDGSGGQGVQRRVGESDGQPEAILPRDPPPCESPATTRTPRPR